MQSKKDYLNVLKSKYHQAKWKRTKTEIINEVINNLGYTRKYAISKLNKPKESLGEKQRRKRKKIYTQDLKIPLVTIWKILNKPCAKRLKPVIEDMISILTKHKELELTSEQKRLLCKMGTWTIDNLLRAEKISKRKGLCGTTPSKYLLNKKIKVRVNFDDIDEPGHLEIDTVHHCGTRLKGNYAVTLNNIDVETLWSEQECFLNCRKKNVIEGFDKIRRRLPFELKSVDFDNGGEFKNYDFVNYCERYKIETTRSRSYKKNDQCYIEGNNYIDVRELIGYLRYGTSKEIEQINNIYRNEHRLLNNFFYPNMKLKVKKRDGAKVTKTYDYARTPYKRILESNISEEEKKQVINLYEELNPAELKRNLDRKLRILYQLNQSSMVRKLDQATA